MPREGWYVREMLQTRSLCKSLSLDPEESWRNCGWRPRGARRNWQRWWWADPWEAGRHESYLQARRKQWLEIERQVKAPYHIHNLPGSILLNSSFIRDFLRSGALSKEHATDLRGSPGCRVSDGRYHRVWCEPSRARRKAWNCPY